MHDGESENEQCGHPNHGTNAGFTQHRHGITGHVNELATPRHALSGLCCFNINGFWQLEVRQHQGAGGKDTGDDARQQVGEGLEHGIGKDTPTVSRAGEFAADERSNGEAQTKGCSDEPHSSGELLGGAHIPNVGACHGDVPVGDPCEESHGEGKQQG